MSQFKVGDRVRIGGLYKNSQEGEVAICYSSGWVGVHLESPARVECFNFRPDELLKVEDDILDVAVRLHQELDVAVKKERDAVRSKISSIFRELQEKQTHIENLQSMLSDAQSQRDAAIEGLAMRTWSPLGFEERDEEVK